MIPAAARTCRNGSTWAAKPCCRGRVRPEVLRRTEQRAVVLQLERLMDYPMVRARVEAGTPGTLHGWHYVIEDGEVHVFDVRSGASCRPPRPNTPAPGPTDDESTRL
jgi:carbonic anhydrase